MYSSIRVGAIVGSCGFECVCAVIIDRGVSAGSVVGVVFGAGGTCAGPDAYLSAFFGALLEHLRLYLCLFIPGFWCHRVGAVSLLVRKTSRASTGCCGV